MKFFSPIFAVLCACCLASCSTPLLSTADRQLATGEYAEAAKTYRKLYNKLKKSNLRHQRAAVAFRLGECHRHLSQAPRAAIAYQNAIRYGYPDSTALLYLAQMLHAQGKYAAAIDRYNEYLGIDSANTMARIGLAGSKMALDKNRATRYIVRPFKIVNTRRSDYAPMYSDKTADILYYTTTDEKVTGERRSTVTGIKNGDIWMLRKDENGRWMRPEPATGDINTDADEGAVSFSPDGSTMYLSRAAQSDSRDTGVEIFVSERADAQWSTPVKFTISDDSTASCAHPAASPDGAWLYFASDMPGGYGGKDIWRINLRKPGSQPCNLGPMVNTPADEMFPYLLTDSVMFFSSNGWPGFGGLDIFRAQLNESGTWSVANMGSPINSAADDYGITYGIGENGFFTSNRGDGRGYDHIYSFTLPDLTIRISGWVLDRDEEPVANAVIRIVGNDGSNQKQVAKADGSFTFPLQRGVKYAMMAGAKGYLNSRQEFVSDTAEVDAEYTIDFLLASVSKPVVVDNIYYDYDKASLRPESETALDEMAQVLRDNPSVSIEMASHTDRHGSDLYNERLSARRAQAVVDYLISAGIDPERLTARGYGKSRPKTITKRLAREHPAFAEGTVLTEEFILTLGEPLQAEADQINRRTEFQVISIVY